MKLNCANFKVKNYLTLIPFGDVHYGSRECDVKVFNAHLNMIKEMGDVAVILMGDMVNVGTRDSVGAGAYDDNRNPEEQYEEMIGFLEPIKEKIIGCHQGNHEERIRNNSSFDISKMLAHELKVPYLQYSALHKIKVNDVNYHVYSVHGSSGATTAAGKMNSCRKMQENVDADIYLHAHTHALDYSPQICYTIDNRARIIEQRTRHFILTGSFVNWDGSYGEKKNYSLSPIGVPKIKLFGNLSRGAKKIEVRFTDR
jgi:predicted phosphodiesterase